MYQIVFIATCLIVTLATVLVVMRLLKTNGDNNIEAKIRTPLIWLTISSTPKNKAENKAKDEKTQKVQEQGQKEQS